jgi:hypothetical protein
LSQETLPSTIQTRLPVAQYHVTKFLIGHGQVPQFDNDIRAFNIGAANLAVRQDVLLTRLRPRILLSSG